MVQYLNWGKGRADVIVKLRGHFVTHIEVCMHLLTCNPGDTESLMFTLLCLRLKNRSVYHILFPQQLVGAKSLCRPLLKRC